MSEEQEQRVRVVAFATPGTGFQNKPSQMKRPVCVKSVDSKRSRKNVYIMKHSTQKVTIPDRFAPLQDNFSRVIESLHILDTYS
jgi:hypothetical protein